MKKVVIAMTLTGLIFSSCSKYEDGPAFSLRTKKGRLCREWVPEKFIDADGTETAASEADGTLEFQKDGVVLIKQGGFQLTGKWEFVSGKEKIKQTYDFPGIEAEELTLLRLTSKELHYKDQDGDISQLKAK